MRRPYVVAFLFLCALVCASIEGYLFAQENSSGKQEKFTPQSGSPVEVTVMEAILSALENNPSLKAQRFTPAIRGTYEEEEWGAFDPTLTAGATVKDDETGTGSLSLSWPLPTGTRPSVSLSGEKRNPTSQTFKASATYSIGITQSLSLIHI